MASLIPYILPAILGGALGSAKARGEQGKGARFSGFLSGALSGAGGMASLKALGGNSPFASMFGTPASQTMGTGGMGVALPRTMFGGSSLDPYL